MCPLDMDATAVAKFACSQNEKNDFFDAQTAITLEGMVLLGPLSNLKKTLLN